MYEQSPYKNLRGGWFFDINSFKIGENTPVVFVNDKEPLKVTLVNERDVGFNFITNKKENAD